MQRNPCHHCGFTLGPGPNCPSCNAPVDRELAARLYAARRLRARIEEEPELDPTLAVELQRRIEVHLQHLRDRAGELTPAAPEELEPPPLPTVGDAAAPTREAAELPTPVAAPPPLPVEAREPAEPPEPGLWSRLGPAFAENILFGLAGFLILGGAIFFGTTAWTTMTGAARLGVVFGGLILLAGTLQGAGRLLNRRQTLPEVERVLGNVAAFIAPLACIVAGEAAKEAPPLGIPLAALGLASTWWFGQRAATLLHPPLRPALARGLSLLGAVGVASAWAGTTPLLAALVTAVMLLATTRPLVRNISAPTRPWWIALSMLGFAALACGAGLALRYEVPIPLRLAPFALLLSAIGLGLAWTEWSYGRRGHPTNARSGLALILALGLALTGATIGMSDPRVMLFGAASACLAALAAAFRFDRSLLLWPALALSVVTYFLLPAPVRELALEIRAMVAGELGYEPQRLPISFYGITFLPYLALCGFAVRWLERRDHPRFAAAVIAWTLSVATALAALSIFAGKDERAPMIVLPSLAAMLTALGAVTRRQKLIFAGGLGFAVSTLPWMAHLELEVASAIELLISCGLALYFAAAALHWRCPKERFRIRAGHALCDAAALCALVVLFWLGSHWLRDWQRIGPELLPAQLGLALWLGALARSYHSPLLKPLAWWSAGMGLLAALGPGALAEPAAGIWLAAASSLPLAAARLRLPLPLPTRPNPAANEPAQAPTTAISILLLQAVALGTILIDLQLDLRSYDHCIAMLVMAAISCGAAVLRDRPWMATIGATQLVIAAPLFTIADGPGVIAFATVATVSASVLLVAAIASAGHRIPRLSALRHAGPVADVGLILTLVWWLVPALNSGILPPWRQAGLTLFTAVALAIAATLRLTQGSGRGVAGSSRAVFALSSVLIIAASCELLGGRDAAFAAAFAAPALLLALTARRHTEALIALHAGLAILIPIIRLAMELPGDGWALAALLAAAMASQQGLRRLPTVGTLMAWVAMSGAGWVTLTWIDPEIDLWWLPVMLLGMATLAQLASRLPATRLERSGNTMFVAGIGALVVLPGIIHAFTCVVAGSAPQLPDAPPLSLDMLALGMAVLAIVTVMDPVSRRSPWLPGSLLLTAPFLAPIGERLLATGESPVGLPMIEFGLLALAAAWLRLRPAHIVLAAATLLLTRFEFGPLAAPIAVTMAAIAPLLAGIRSRRAAEFGLHADALMVAAAIWVLHLDQNSGWVLLPWIAGCAAALALIETGLATLPQTRAGFGIEISTSLRSASNRATIAAIGLSALSIFASELDHHWQIGQEHNLLLAAALISTFVLSARRASRESSAAYTHLAVLSLVLLFSQAALHTDLLDWLGDHQLSLLTLAAIGMLVARRHAAEPVNRALCVDAMLLPIPAVLALGTDASIAGSTALALAAAPYAIASRQLGWSFGGWIAAALLNAAVWSLWRYAGVVDPSLYGLPLGMTLVLGSEVARQRVTRAVARSAGLVVMYGSIAVQILRIEEPTHALLLFALGLLTVGFGFWKKRNDYLLAGAAAVVVDVIAYLLQHGLARDFVGAGLLVGAGLTLLAAGVARRRIQSQRVTTGGNGDRSA